MRRPSRRPEIPASSNPYAAEQAGLRRMLPQWAGKPAVPSLPNKPTLPQAPPPAPNASKPSSLLEMLSGFLASQMPREPVYPPLYDPNARPNIAVPQFRGPALGVQGESDWMRLDRLNREGLAADLAAQQGLAQGDIAAQQAGIGAELAAMPQAAPQRQFAPYTPPTLPAREQYQMPERQAPRMDPLSGLAAALFGFIVPEGAGRFTSSAMQGAVNRADRAYEDRLRAFETASQQADTRYADALRQQQQDAQYGEANLRGREATAYQNALNDYNAQIAQAPMRGEQSRLQSLAGQITPQTLLARSAGEKQLEGQAVARKISYGLSQNQAIADAQQKEADRRVDLYKANVPITTANINAQQRDLASKRDENIAIQRIKSDDRYRNAELKLKASDQALRSLDMTLRGLRDGFVFDQKARSWRYDKNLATQIGDQTQRKADVVYLEQQYRAFLQAQNRRANYGSRIAADYRKQNPEATEEDTRRVLNSDSHYQALLTAESDMANDLQNERAWFEMKYTPGAQVMQPRSGLPGLPGTRSIVRGAPIAPKPRGTKPAPTNQRTLQYDPLTDSFK